MQNIKRGTLVYHYMNMAKVGTVVEINATNNKIWLTEGTPMVSKVAIVRYEDGTTETLKLGDLMRADLD